MSKLLSIGVLSLFIDMTAIPVWRSPGALRSSHSLCPEREVDSVRRQTSSRECCSYRKSRLFRIVAFKVSVKQFKALWESGCCETTLRS